MRTQEKRTVSLALGLLVGLGALVLGQDMEEAKRAGGNSMSEAAERVKQAFRDKKEQDRKAEEKALRFIKSDEVKRKYRSAKASAQKGEHMKAWDAYKSLLESPESKGSFVEYPERSGSYMPVDLFARHALEREFEGLSSKDKGQIEKEARGKLENVEGSAEVLLEKVGPYRSTKAGLPVLIKAADRLVEAGEYAEAISVYAEVIELHFHGAKTPESEPIEKKLAMVKTLRAKPREGVPDAGIEWINIPGGTFMMGSEEDDKDGRPNERPRHPVTLRSFYMSKTLVTYKQYQACVKAGKCETINENCLKDHFRADENQPAVCVSWNRAKAFAEWAGGRLPTEAEWEYAARSAGKDQKYPWGNEEATCERAIMGDNDGPGCGRNSTWPVCSKPKGNTEQGLCDMAGNVWEWVQDTYHESYEDAPKDGSPWEDSAGSYRFARGGAWDFSAKYLRSAYRDSLPGVLGDDRGFRLAGSRP